MWAPIKRRGGVRIGLCAAIVALCACTAPPPRPHRPPAEAISPASPTAVQPPDTTVYAYPLKGQSPDQQDRDRYECYVWAVKQTGFDPSAPQLSPAQRVRVVTGPPAGSAVVGGAVAGAVVGAAVSNPRHSAEGAVVGAIAGATIGVLSDAQRAETLRRAQSTEEAQETAQRGALEQRASDYRRASGACLQARGYTVQ